MGHESAKIDVAKGRQNNYHLRRARAYFNQLPIILDWYNSGCNQKLLFVSACPNTHELDSENANKQAFKQDRMMASLQLFSKTKDGQIAMEAFSLDNLDHTGLQILQYTTKANGELPNTTLELLTKPWLLDEQFSSDLIISKFDQELGLHNAKDYKQGMDISAYKNEANDFIEQYPEAYQLYYSVISEVAKSYRDSYITSQLAHLTNNVLASDFINYDLTIPTFLQLNYGDIFDINKARDLIEYLRSQALPQFFINQLEKSCQECQVSFGYSSDSVGSAGAMAYSSGISYSGACPVSISQNNSLELGDANQAELMELAKVYNVLNIAKPKPLIIRGNYELLPIGKCPVCSAECGTGIRNIKTGIWKCTAKGCKEFDQKLYNYVFGIKTPTDKKPDKKIIKPKDKQQLNNPDYIDNNPKINEIQAEIWRLEYLLYNQENNIQEIKDQLFALKQQKHAMLMGYEVDI